MSDTHASKRYGVFENGNEMSTVITGTVLYQAMLRSRTSSRYGTVYGLSPFFSKIFLSLPSASSPSSHDLKANRNLALTLLLLDCTSKLINAKLTVLVLSQIIIIPGT